ncbi:lipid-A-disaccharide synthase [Oceaniovalibus guishaninsula JLT2003]|uniref:Lipid-A-disaccharide synthase n=1 Tax=Oceaniovalibus guishaninsula JLT2003 TaxID=1231392 RepID=K2H7L5_9RHOB|nr:lipid-A-disaccharide synthase [Oceaniovalibus guishaninsula JLT2003]
MAGEASGDRLGAALMDGLRALRPETRFHGVGGAEMTRRGLNSLFPMSELSVMGLAEVLPRYRHLRRRMIQTADAVLDVDPDVLITVDSPDFCLRVASRVRARRRLRTVHYVAPSVWAWRPKRAQRMAPFVDQVLALLPFEPPYMEAAGMRCDFVGHPVATERRPEPAAIRAFRSEVAGEDGPLLLALPGSRLSELRRLAPVFGAALQRLAGRHPGLRVVLPVAPGMVTDVRGLTADWRVRPVILDPARPGAARRKRLAFHAADAALAASGTVSLELAAADTPMVVAYDMNWLSWQIMRRMVRIDTVTLVNLIEGRHVVPEFLGPACRPDPIAAALDGVLADPSRQRPALARTMRALGRGGGAPGLRAAHAVLNGLGAG